MSTDDKIQQFVEALEAGTDSGKIRWESSVQSEKFQTNLGGYVVQIGSYDVPDHQGDFQEHWYLQLINNAQEVVDRIDSGEPGPVPMRASRLRLLHTKARRSARDADTAYDNILTLLKAS